MSLFSSETRTEPESKPRYTAEELRGKGLQRLSYFVESRYVTRKFKNHLKHLGIFSPAYRRDDDREQVFIRRPPIRRFAEGISNRRFKSLWIREHGSIKGLKDQPRSYVPVPDLHVGTLHKSRGKFYRNPFLSKGDRRGLSRPIRWAKQQLRVAAKAFRRLAERANCGGNGPQQSEANPASPEPLFESLVPRHLIVSNDWSHTPLSLLLSGNTSHLRELASRGINGTFRYWVFGPDGRPTVVSTSDYPLDDPPEED